MDRLWAPWRKAYIRPDKKKTRGCVFCGILKSKDDTFHFVLTRTKHAFAVLNLYPYNNGHTLILPRRHIADISKLTDEEKLDWMNLASEVQEALQKKVRPDGFNLGINLGSAAGAGIPKHLHFHVVPRWKGDSNFMPVLGGTKVISESLQSMYREIAPLLVRRHPL